MQLDSTERNTAHRIAQAIATECDDQTIVNLLNSLVGIEASSLDDRTVAVAEHLFDHLCDIRPDCRELAQDA